MKFGVITFPGSNCDDDMVHVLGTVMGQPVVKIWHKEHKLKGLEPSNDCIVIPGGFSYGDYLRSGAIARFSPIMQSVVDFAKSGGIVFGICNGFQVLCEAHLLPGALLHNSNQKFIGKTVYIKSSSRNSPVTSGLRENAVLKMPIAHAEGRYYADEGTVEQLENDGRVLFRYCDADGNVDERSNPNGSVNNIAGICNVERNVIGMMPHPERASEAVLGLSDGITIFESLLQYQKQPA